MAGSLSIIIVHYKARADLEACLESLNGADAEVIVVDNDGSAAGVDARFPWVRLLPQAENRWFCGGNNIGLAAASGDYALLLNPDTVVIPGALDTLRGFMDVHPDYAGATIQMRYPDGTIQRTCSRIPSYSYLLLEHTPLGWLLPGLRRRVAAQHWYADWDRQSDRDVAVLPGSCLLMRRADLHLCDDLWLYFPEDDLARRFAGRHFRFLAGEHIIHREKSVTRTWLATRVYFRDLMIYARAHHGAAGAALLWLLSRPLWWAMLLKRRFTSTGEGTYPSP